MKHEDFERVVNEGVNSVPKEFLEKLENVVIIIEDDPSPSHVKRFNLNHGFTLFGLYEGVPQTQGYGLIPAKITIFKNPIIASSRNIEDMKKIVKHTVWHEIAHAFGMDEERVREAEKKRQKRTLKKS